MTVMRLSVTVPYDLWARTIGHDGSPSRIIQDALRLMIRSEDQKLRDLLGKDSPLW